MLANTGWVVDIEVMESVDFTILNSYVQRLLPDDSTTFVVSPILIARAKVAYEMHI